MCSGFGARAPCPAIRQCPRPLPSSPGQIPLSPTAWPAGAGGCRWHPPTCPQMFWSLTFPLFYHRVKCSNPDCVPPGGILQEKISSGGKGFSPVPAAGSVVALVGWLPWVWHRSRPQGCALCRAGWGGQPRSQPLPFHHRPTQKSHHYWTACNKIPLLVKPLSSETPDGIFSLLSLPAAQ